MPAGGEPDQFPIVHPCWERGRGMVLSFVVAKPSPQVAEQVRRERWVNKDDHPLQFRAAVLEKRRQQEAVLEKRRQQIVSSSVTGSSTPQAPLPLLGPESPTHQNPDTIPKLRERFQSSLNIAKSFSTKTTQNYDPSHTSSVIFSAPKLRPFPYIERHLLLLLEEVVATNGDTRPSGDGTIVGDGYVQLVVVNGERVVREI